MNCTNCGAALPPGTGFCGGCGRPAAPQQGYPPPQQGYPPPQQGYPPPQQGYPPPQQGYPPPQQGYAQPPQQGGQLFGSLRPYPIVMHRGMTRLTGQLYVAPARLYFICESNKGGLAVALGKGIGGLVGGVIAAAGAPTPGQAGGAVDEHTLQIAAQQHEGSLVMEARLISCIKDTWLTHAIWHDGVTYALRSTLDKQLKLELGHWCQAYNIRHAGLLPK